MRRTLWIYRRLLGAHIRAVMQYEADFWILVVAAIMLQVVGVVFLSAVFTRIPTMHGWTFWDIVLVYAMVTIGEGVGSLFFEGTWRLAWKINHGELDYLLTRPFPVVLQVVGDAVGFNGFGNLITGGILLGLGATRGDIDWTAGTVALGIGLMVCAVIIKLAISLATNSASFWIAGPYSIFGYAMHQVGELARYPITIYSVGVRLAIGVAIPFAFTSFFPVALLRGGSELAWIGALTPLVALYCVGVALWLFRRGLRRYESAGN